MVCTGVETEKWNGWDRGKGHRFGSNVSMFIHRVEMNLTDKNLALLLLLTGVSGTTEDMVNEGLCRKGEARASRKWLMPMHPLLL